MPPFVPPEPPIEPDAPTPPPELLVPLPPPEVGFGSPWAPADAENRDRILDWWRMWWRRVFFPWVEAWVAYWAGQWARIVAYLNEWLEYAGQYIEDHAVAGLSWRRTDDEIVPEATTLVEIAPLPNADIRPLVVGEYVSDTTREVNYGVIVTVVDETHATVLWVGSLLGLPGYGWWSTVTEIVDSGTTAVVLVAVPGREPQVNDLVVSTAESDNYGRITVVTDPTNVTVEYLGSLRGPAGVADLGSFDFTTPNLEPFGDPGDTYQGQLSPWPQMVGAFVLTTDWPSWVRVYASEAYMIADEGRDPMTPLDISDDHGCYLDFVSIPSELSKTLTPGIMFTDIGLGVWLSVRNMDVNDPNSVDIHFDYRTFRE
jgi:hypothetical protein